MSITWSEVSRGVPRSPNRHLGQLCIFGQFEIAGCKVECDGFSDVRAGFVLGFASRRAAGKFRAHRRVVTGLGITFQNDSERHTNSIGPLPQPGELGCPTARPCWRAGNATWSRCYTHDPCRPSGAANFAQPDLEGFCASTSAEWGLGKVAFARCRTEDDPGSSAVEPSI